MPGTGSPRKRGRLADQAAAPKTWGHDNNTDHWSEQGAGLRDRPRLGAAGHTVYVGSRDAERGRRAAERLGARAVRLDVTDDASVEAAVKAIEADGGLDVLINNAGVEEG
ncbi:SDR family NAD(P)-dependent oxidoreductase [Streptosporangium lutulentum]